MTGSLSLSLCLMLAYAFPGTQWGFRQGTNITEGVGVSSIIINKSTAADVAAAYGSKFSVHTHNEYSREIEYVDLGLSFYYCLKDKQQKIFLIEVHHGATSKGIIIGRSTLKDVRDIYGKEDGTGNCDSSSCVYEYKGVQFYVEGPKRAAKDTDIKPSQMKVVEIDVMAPDKSSNFCDDI